MRSLSTMKNGRLALLLCALSWVSRLAFAHDPAHNGDIKIENAWVRATVAGQKATAAFMTLTSKNGYVLSEVKSPAAGVAQVHEMKMENTVMKMRNLEDGLELPAGKAVALKPGGYHIMLMDLKQSLAEKSKIELQLTFKDAAGKLHTTTQSLPVSMQPVSMQSVTANPHSGHENMQHGEHGK